MMDLELEILDVWDEEDGARCEKVRNRPNYEKWVRHSLTDIALRCSLAITPPNGVGRPLFTV